MKRLLAMLVLSMSVSALADTWTDPDTDYTWTYRINGDTAEIYNDYYSAAISPEPTGAVTIPSSLGGKPVTSIGSSAFSGCSGLTSVTIPNSVTNIGYGAFYGCSRLTSVTIPDSATYIWRGAFYGCSGLTSVTIPDSVTSIGECAFSDCIGLTSITIPDSVTSIGDFAFSGCNGLTSVTIPDSVTSIGSYAFQGCSGLTSVTIPNSVTSDWIGAFEDCYNVCEATVPGWQCGIPFSNVTNLVISMGTTSIGDFAFSGCRGLTSVTIPDSVTSIGDEAFFGCSSLTSITIPDSVTRIGSSAFQCCSGLTSVTIPDSVTSIGNSAFAWCSSLTSVTIPDSVTSIGGNAFEYCSGFTSVTIPDSVTSIGSYAFYYCSGLTSVTIPDSVTSIGDRAFRGCSSLTSVTFKGDAPVVDSYTFADVADGCEAIVSPDSTGWGVEEGEMWYRLILRYADDGATETITVTFDANGGECGESSREVQEEEAIGELPVPTREGYEFAGWWTEAEGGEQVAADTIITAAVTYYAHWIAAPVFNIDENGVLTSVELNGATEVVIPDDVTSIGDCAFYNCSGLTSVAIPDSVTSIGGDAFYSCSGLTSLTIPNSVTNIEGKAFNGCSGLMSLTIPDSVTSIGKRAFTGCSSLTSITIGSGVTSINEGGEFDGCASLTNVIFKGDAPVVDNYTFAEVADGCEAIVSRNSTGWGVDAGEMWYGLILRYADDGAAETITVTFDANGGECGESSREVQEEEAIGELPVPTREGYEFAGWWTEAEGGEQVTADRIMTETATCYAHWIDVGVVFNIDANGVLTSVELNGATEVVIPDGVTSIGYGAFRNCSSLTSVTIPDSATSIERSAFEGCSGLTSVTIPNSVTSIGNGAFEDCSRLASVVIPDSVTSIGGDAFGGTAYDAQLQIKINELMRGVGVGGGNAVSLTVTNVVVHYVMQSVQSPAVTPTEQTGLVNIIAEVTSGGPVAISSTWADQYPDFESKFGSDFTAALTKPTGKRDGAGNAMLVWQDFVAGTDPTKEDDVFKADITFDAEGNPIISWTPELSEAEAAKRSYKKYGKVKLNDAEWTLINGNEADYNFFKVSVEMK